jgi:hypothetical protein
MARARKATPAKPAQSGAARIKSSVHYEPEVYKLLRLASIESGIDMSDIINALVKERFAGWHIRKGRAGSVDVTSPADTISHDVLPGTPSESSGTTSVRIPSVSDRIGMIARRAHEPVDDAISDYVRDIPG